MEEIWKDINGYEGLYKVSNYGNIISLERLVLVMGKPLRKLREKIRLQTITQYGYKSIILRKNGMSKIILVHRIVATAFIENPFNKPQVNHKDGIKDNNHAENLEWCTAKENIIHSFLDNKRVPTRGQNNFLSKLIDSEVFEIKKLIESGIPKPEIAKRYNVTERTIRDINNQKTWKHIINQ